MFETAWETTPFRHKALSSGRLLEPCQKKTGQQPLLHGSCYRTILAAKAGWAQADRAPPRTPGLQHRPPKPRSNPFFKTTGLPS